MGFKEYLKERKEQEFSFLALLEASEQSFWKIAPQVGMTPRGVQLAVYRALDKIYYGLKNENKDLSPFAVFGIMTKALAGVKPDEIFKNLHPSTQKEIQDDAKKQLGRE